jgi:hypothetical protein
MSKQAINQDDVDSQNAAPEEGEGGFKQARPRSPQGVPGFSQGNGRSSMNGFKLDDKLIGIGH